MRDPLKFSGAKRIMSIAHWNCSAIKCSQCNVDAKNWSRTIAGRRQHILKVSNKPERLKQRPLICIYTEITKILWTSTVDSNTNRSLGRLEISKKKKFNIHVFHCFLFAFRVNIKRVFTDTFTDNELHCRQTRDMEAANLMFKFDSLL